MITGMSNAGGGVGGSRQGSCTSAREGTAIRRCHHFRDRQVGSLEAPDAGEILCSAPCVGTQRQDHSLYWCCRREAAPPPCRQGRAHSRPEIIHRFPGSTDFGILVAGCTQTIEAVPPGCSPKPPSLPHGGGSRRSSFSPSVQQPPGHPRNSGPQGSVR